MDTILARCAQRLRRALACAALLGSILALPAARASDGQLDPTFGAGGRVYLGWDADGGNVADDVAIAVLAPSDGSVLLVGNATDAGAGYSGVNAIGIAKLTPFGTFDTRFGDLATPGQMKIHGPGNFPYSGRIAAHGAVLQPDGKIVIVGSTYFPEQARSLATVWRVTADGVLDTAFGSGGSTSIDRGQLDEYDTAFGVAIVHGVKNTTYDALEGRIVVAGSYDFDHGLVVAQSWIFELDPNGVLVPNGTDGSLGQNTYNWGVTDCADGGSYYHDQTFVAIRFLYVPETNTLRFFAAGDCLPRPGTSVPFVPYIAAIDSNLGLVPSFGNNDNGISEISFMPTGTSYPNSYVSSLDVDPAGLIIVYTGYYYPADGGASQALEGALDGDGQFQRAWTNGGVTAFRVGSVSTQANAVVIRPNQGHYFIEAEDIVAGRFDDGPCQPGVVCGLQGAHFLAAAEYFGSQSPYCGSNAGLCHYEYSGVSDEGAYAASLTQGDKVLLAGYVTFNDGHTDFAVLRLQGEEIFFDGFGPATYDFR